jgi:cytochrome d ubiquinol oxidase subunit II
MIPHTLIAAQFLGIDYADLWFLVVGALFSGYAVLDGFDLGAGAWHLFFKKEQSRRIALNAVGPVWDGNEVWLVIGGGALFAGFPVLYAVLFSSMYIPFMLFLLFLILRAVAIEFRGKEEMVWWRKTWDIAYSVSSAAMALALGVVLGNVLQGIAIGEAYRFEGQWLDFFNPFALLTGATTLALFMVHGAIYLSMKTEGRLYAKLGLLLRRAIYAFFFLFAITTAYALIGIPHLTDDLRAQPYLTILPAAAFVAMFLLPRFARKQRYRTAFALSSLTLCLLLGLVAAELFPVLLRSSLDEAYHLTVKEAAASDKSLGIMLGFAAVGTPLVLSYTAFVYWTFRGKVQLDEHSY